MKIRISWKGDLRICPECLQPWPADDVRLDLRSFRWLHPLPRNISPSNVDCVIHDGANGDDRLLFIEVKRADEGLAAAQLWLLKAISKLPAVEVLLVQEQPNGLVWARIRPEGSAAFRSTTRHELRESIGRWLAGATKDTAA